MPTTPEAPGTSSLSGKQTFTRALTDEQIAAMRDPKLIGTVNLPTIEDAVEAGGFLAGRPEDVIEQLKAVERRIQGSTGSFAQPRSALRSRFSSKTPTALRRM